MPNSTIVNATWFRC